MPGAPLRGEPRRAAWVANTISQRISDVRCATELHLGVTSASPGDRPGQGGQPALARQTLQGIARDGFPSLWVVERGSPHSPAMVLP
ncbi:hypothetical protein EHM76_00170 [bacterium]|nr:MAG: hypothetical protein EHM76_00170 [bacterium]